MPSKTFYLDLAGGGFGGLVWSETAPGTTATDSITTVSPLQVGNGDYTLVDQQDQVDGRNDFVGTVPSLSTTGHSIRTSSVFTLGSTSFDNEPTPTTVIHPELITFSSLIHGVFDAGTWDVSMEISHQNGATGQLYIEMYKGTFTTSSVSMTQIPFPLEVGDSVFSTSWADTSGTTTVTASFDTDPIEVAGQRSLIGEGVAGKEFIAMRLGWYWASSPSNRRVCTIRYGSNMTVTTPNFRKRIHVST